MRKRDIKAALKKARALIAQGWTDKVFVRDTVDGRCYCAMGAINKAVVGTPNAIRSVGDPLDQVLVYFANVIKPGNGDPFMTIGMFNDSNIDSGPVLAMFDKAIAA